MLNSIALLLASSTSVKFQMLQHETITNNYRMVISPILNDKKLDIPLSNQSTEQGKIALQVKNALITPFTIVGTIEELEQQLPVALAEISEPRIEAKNNLDSLIASLNTATNAKSRATKKKTPKVSKTPEKESAVKTVAQTQGSENTAQEKSVDTPIEQNAQPSEEPVEQKASLAKEVVEQPHKNDETLSQVTLF